MTHKYGFNWTPAKGQTTGLERACTRWPCEETCRGCVCKTCCAKYAKSLKAKRWPKGA